MANKARGFVEFALGERSVNIALGLGALAEIEDAFGVESFEDALAFGDKTSAAHLLKIVFAILAGNDVELTETERTFVKTMNPADFMGLITGLMEAGGMTKVAPAPEGEAEAKRPLGGKNAGKRG